MKKITIILAILVAVLSVKAQDIGGQYYVAHPDSTYSGMSSASDSNDGSYANPWATWQKAFETAIAGDTVYFRGGTWMPDTVLVGTNSVQRIEPKLGAGNNGAPGNRIYYLNYPSERPILDCSKVHSPPANPNSDGSRYLTGLNLTDVHFLYFRGLTVCNLYQRGEENVRTQGLSSWVTSNITFENITIHNIGTEGFYGHSAVGLDPALDFGWDGTGVIPYDTIRLINTDIYNCCDSVPAAAGSGVPYNMGDGFKLISYPGAYIYIDGCRFWHCSDDGMDMPGKAERVVKNCWSFGHRDPDWVGGEGNGFKTAGVSINGDYYDPNLNYVTFYNNLSCWNVQGLYLQEYKSLYRSNSRVYNNTFYKNKIGMTINANEDYPATNTEMWNNIIYEVSAKDAGGRPYIHDMNFYYPGSNNSWIYDEFGSLSNWDYDPNLTIDDNDFVLIDSIQGWAQLTAPRKPDGSLPDITFLKLKEGSDLIDYGADVGLSYKGVAPDLGYSESAYIYLPNGDSILISTAAMLQDSISNGRQSGDIIYIKNNSITGDINVNTNGLMLRSAKNYNAVINGTLTISADSATIKGITVADASNCIAVGSVSDVVIDSCTINATGTAVTLNRVHNLTFTNNTLSGGNLVYSTPLRRDALEVIDYNSYNVSTRFNGMPYNFWRSKHLEFDRNSSLSY